MAPKNLINKTKLAKLTKLSRPAVTKACNNKLKAAIVGKLIDIDHPSVIQYIEFHQNKKTPKAVKSLSKKKTVPKKIKTKTISKKEAPASTSSIDDTEEPGDTVDSSLQSDYLKDRDVKKVAHLTLLELVKKHGTDIKFESWVRALKVIGEIRQKNLLMAEKEGKLIHKDLVKTHVFGAIENSNKKLLIDTPKALARRLFALAKSKGTIAEAEALVIDIIGKQLKNIKTTAQRILKEDG